uniref:Pco121713 n=1 Tax=Arundo donax TaxID=35708 RepID=A0A0A9D224_ARUDO
MCITWEYRSMFINFSTFTDPGLETLPTSFLPKSTSIMCSAHCFSSLNNCCSCISSSFSVFPLRVVPASGRLIIFPFLTLVRISGLDATRTQPLACTYAMYGLGFTIRKAR